MGVNYTEWRFQLMNERTETPIDDDSGVVNVLTAGSPAEITIYSDDRGTAASNPLTMTNGVARFFTATSVTSVDLSILTANGDAIFIQGATPSNQKIMVEVDKLEQVLVAPFAASDNVETDTGFTLKGDCLIKDCRLKVTTVDATETIDVGLNGTITNDPNGLIAAASVATAGYVELKPQIANGVNIDYVGTNYVGALLATSIPGADAVATVGGWTKVETLVAAAETDCNITYTGSAGSDTAAGYIFLEYLKLP